MPANIVINLFFRELVGFCQFPHEQSPMKKTGKRNTCTHPQSGWNRYATQSEQSPFFCATHTYSLTRRGSQHTGQREAHAVDGSSAPSCNGDEDGARRPAPTPPRKRCPRDRWGIWGSRRSRRTQKTKRRSLPQQRPYLPQRPPAYAHLRQQPIAVDKGVWQNM